MIVDTSFVLDVVDGVDAAVSTEQELEASGVPLVVPSMTVLELYIGVGKVANTAAERQHVEAILNSYPVVKYLGVKPRGFAVLGPHRTRRRI